MTFLHPELLWMTALLGGSMGLASRARARRTRKVERYLHGHPGGEFWPEGGRGPVLPGFWGARTLFLVAAGLLLALAAAGPRTGTRLIPVLVSAKPLVLVLDVSRSMAVPDVPSGRLGAARIQARRVVPRLPATPIALMVFAGDAHLLLPASYDRSLLYRYLDTVDPDLLTHQGSSLASALRLGLTAMERGDLEEGTVFLVLSDGEHHEAPEAILSLAGALREAGGRVAALSLGTTVGGGVPAPDGPGLPLMLPLSHAETVNGIPFSRARPGFLADLARSGGGIFARGENAAEATALFDWIGAWGTKGSGVELEEVPVEGWPWFLGPALFLLMMELAMEMPWNRKDARWS